MAPRSAKAKKTAVIKLSDTQAPKKGRGKAKKIDEVEQGCGETELVEKIAETEKKTRGRKGTNVEKEELNGNAEEIMPPKKIARKKKELTPEEIELPDETDNKDTIEDSCDQPESNVTSEITVTNGGKRQSKKQTGGKVDSILSMNGRKTTKQESDNEDSAPKVTKGRGRKAQSKVELEHVEELVDEEGISEPATKGRKKAAAKGIKAKDTVEMEEAKLEETEKSKEIEEKPKKGKGRKNQTKKPKAEENNEWLEKRNENEEPAAKKIKFEAGQGEPQEEGTTEVKPAKGRRGKKPVEAALESPELHDTGETSNKRRRKLNEEKGN